MKTSVPEKIMNTAFIAGGMVAVFAIVTSVAEPGGNSGIKAHFYCADCIKTSRADPEQHLKKAREQMASRETPKPMAPSPIQAVTEENDNDGHHR